MSKLGITPRAGVVATPPKFFNGKDRTMVGFFANKALYHLTGGRAGKEGLMDHYKSFFMDAKKNLGETAYKQLVSNMDSNVLRALQEADVDFKPAHLLDRGVTHIESHIESVTKGRSLDSRKVTVNTKGNTSPRAKTVPTMAIGGTKLQNRVIAQA